MAEQILLSDPKKAKNVLLLFSSTGIEFICEKRQKKREALSSMCQAVSGLYYAVSNIPRLQYGTHATPNGKTAHFFPFFSLCWWCATTSFVTVFSAFEWKPALYVICIVCGRESFSLLQKESRRTVSLRHLETLRGFIHLSLSGFQDVYGLDSHS